MKKLHTIWSENTELNPYVRTSISLSFLTNYKHYRHCDTIYLRFGKMVVQISKSQQVPLHLMLRRMFLIILCFQRYINLSSSVLVQSTPYFSVSALWKVINKQYSRLPLYQLFHIVSVQMERQKLVYLPIRLSIPYIQKPSDLVLLLTAYFFNAIRSIKK